MKQNSQNSDQSQDKELMIVVAIGLVVLVLWMIWEYARDIIVWFSFSLTYAQLYLLSWIVDFGPVTQGYMEFLKGVFRSPDDPLYVDPFSVEWKEISFMSNLAGSYFKWLYTFLIAAMSIMTMFKMKGGGMSRKFSLTGSFGASLADFQAEHWKVFSPGAKFDPDALSAEELPARTPMEWMQLNNVSLKDGEIDTEAAEEAFTKQLGERWQGMDKAPAHIKALCVAFYLNAKRDKSAREVKEQISVAYTAKSRSEAEKEIEELFQKTLADPKFSKMIDKYAKQHAYTNTAMFRLITWSRNLGGVFASAEIRWLKPIDRSLWYALNNCGRRSYHTEGAGAVCHFNAENIVGGALAEPHVDQAIDGLYDYIDHQGLLDIDEFFNGTETDF